MVQHLGIMNGSSTILGKFHRDQTAGWEIPQIGGGIRNEIPCKMLRSKGLGTVAICQDTWWISDIFRFQAVLVLVVFFLQTSRVVGGMCQSHQMRIHVYFRFDSYEIRTSGWLFLSRGLLYY